jgi:hypothetical protein
MTDADVGKNQSKLMQNNDLELGAARIVTQSSHFSHAEFAIVAYESLCQNGKKT